MTSLNESAEDLMPETMKSYERRESNPEDELHNIKRYQEKAGATVGLSASSFNRRMTPTRRGGSGWVPTARPTNLIPRFTADMDTGDVVMGGRKIDENDASAVDHHASISSRASPMAAAAHAPQRTSPRRRQGTGRVPTVRAVEFKRRQNAVESVQESEPEPEPVRQLVLPCKGRRTGLKIRQDIRKDQFGFEDLSEFWNAEVEVTPKSRRVSFRSGMEVSPVTGRPSTMGGSMLDVTCESMTSCMSIAGSEEPDQLNEDNVDDEEDQDMEMAESGGEDISPSSSTRSSGQSSHSASSGRRSSERLSSSKKGDSLRTTINAESVSSKNSDSSNLDNSILSPDPEAIKKLTFDEGSGGRSSRRSSAASMLMSRVDSEEADDEAVPEDGEASMNVSNLESDQEVESSKKLSFEERRRSSMASKRSSVSSKRSSVASQEGSPHPADENEEEDNENELSMASKRSSKASQEGSPHPADENNEEENDNESFGEPDNNGDMEEVEDEADRCMSDLLRQADQIDADNRKRKKRELDALAKTGRASYSVVDTYAKKGSRLSMFAPRPEVEDDCGARRSKRRKMRPLEYWRNERVHYQRANKSPGSVQVPPNRKTPYYSPKTAVPEIVDVDIRSPAPTPWRRKSPKKKGADGDDAEEQGKSSVDSKAATAKKAARNKKKKEKKVQKGKKQVVESDDQVEAQGQSGEVSADTDEFKYKSGDTPAKKSRMVDVSRISDRSSISSTASNADPKKKTAFFLFCKERRSQVRQQHPNYPIAQQAMVLSEMWRGLRDSEKQSYHQLVGAE